MLIMCVPGAQRSGSGAPGQSSQSKTTLIGVAYTPGLADDSLVFIMRSDPEPQQPVGSLHRYSSMMQPDSG